MSLITVSRYLETLKPKATDNSSFWRKADLSKPPAWAHEGAVPDSLAFAKRITEKKFETLTVARLGDWSGAMQPIRYPVQVIDAFRDIVLNVAWQSLQPTGGFLFMELAGYPFNGYLSDDYLSSDKVKYFQGLGINPTAWASRSARTQVINSATRSVVICQQMLVDWLQNDNDQYNSVVRSINRKLHLTGNSAWTGSIWPFGKSAFTFNTNFHSDHATGRLVDSASTCAHQHASFQYARSSPRQSGLPEGFEGNLHRLDNQQHPREPWRMGRSYHDLGDQETSQNHHEHSPLQVWRRRYRQDRRPR